MSTEQQSRSDFWATEQKYGSAWSKFTTPILGLIQLFVVWLIMSYSKNVSMWDYEGFSFMNTFILISGIYWLAGGVYYFNKGGFSFVHQQKAKKKRSMPVRVLAASVLIFTFLAIMYYATNPNSTYKYYLPLKNIETTQIEGTVVTKTTLDVKDWGDTNGYVNGLQPHVYLQGGLKEFPNIYFSYTHNFNLKNDILNIGKRTELPAGTKISLKIRTKDYEELMAFMERGEHLDPLVSGEYDMRRSVHYYELEIDDEVIVRKFGLE